MPRFAAIDIGSNSVRMEAAEVNDGEPQRILASDRQVTRLGANVFRAGRISQEAMDFLCVALSGMAAQYQKLDVAAVRAVATSAVRDSSNQQEFLARTSAAIGAPVEIISGQEEARLIHLGVQSRWPQDVRRVVMIDIGGGSAEIIASQNRHVEEAVSKQLGALRLNEVFLRSDPPRPAELRRMEEYIDERIAPTVRRILKTGTAVDRAIGTSATASAIVCAVNNVPRSKRDEADRMRAQTAQIRKLYQDLTKKDVAARQKVTGIGPRRAEIIIAGAAVLVRILEALKVSSLYYSAAGVRDGIISDLAARGAERDTLRLTPEQREVVEDLATRYMVPLPHGKQSARFAGLLFEALEPLHKLPHRYCGLLEAAAYLHDIGHFISDTRHHKHSYYLVANSDLPGFDQREREILANLCRYHRKAAPAPEHTNLQPLDAEGKRAVMYLAPLLRIADSADRSQHQRVGSLRCNVKGNDVQIHLGSEEDVDLEVWAVERAGDYFKQVYGKNIVVSRS
jgi:exopolyphosphatase/guanosine-5'-triphosphate,3'-diphosphate pyrophosphatase